MIDGESEDGDCDVCKMWWTRRRVNRMRLTERRRKEGVVSCFCPVKQHAWLLLCANWHSCSCQQVDRRKKHQY